MINLAENKWMYLIYKKNHEGYEPLDIDSQQLQVSVHLQLT